MFCPNLSDPTIKAQFEKLQSIVPEYAYYLWDKYQGEVPAKYYNLPKSTIKEGVEELFVTDPKLANQVYEALGFNTRLKVSLGKELQYKDAYVSESRLKDFKQYEVLDENNNPIGNVVIEYRGDKSVILHPKLSITSKGYGKDLYKLISSKFNVEIQEWSEGTIDNSNSAKKMWDSLEKEGVAKRMIDIEQGDNFRVLNYSNQIPPQQKQQAIQQYSAYLDTIFPDSKVKDIVYHGTDKGKDILKNGFTKNTKGYQQRLVGNNVSGFYFAKNKNVANQYREDRDDDYKSIRSQNGALNLLLYIADRYGKTPETITINDYTSGLDDVSFFGWQFITNGTHPTGVTSDNIKSKLTYALANAVEYSIEVEPDTFQTFRSVPLEDNLRYSPATLYTLVNIRKPLEVNKGGSVKKFSDVFSEAKNKIKNEDGVIAYNVDDNTKNAFAAGTSAYGDEVVVFEPEQIHILGNKQDIAGFKKFVASNVMPTTMFSRKDAKFVSDRAIRLERQLDFLKQVQQDPEYWKLTFPEKRAYVSTKHFNEVVELVGGRNSVNVVGNRFYLSTTRNVRTSDAVYRYAHSLAHSINQMFPFVSSNSPANVRQAYDGTTYVEFDLSGRYATPLLEAVETIDEEEMRAEMELFDIQENLTKEQLGLFEKLESANELLIDAEGLPYSGIMFHKSLSLLQSLKRPNIAKHTKLLNKLVERFPGVTWAWNNQIAEAGRVNLATGQIEINPDLIDDETPWHEFGHFVVRGIRESNPELFEELKKEIQRLHDSSPTSSAYFAVESMYPEYANTDSFWEEAIVTELGRQSAKKENRNLFEKVLDWFKSFVKGFNPKATKINTMSNLVDSLVDPNTIFEFVPDNNSVAEYMFQRILNPELVDSLTQYVRPTENAPFEFQTYAEKIQVISSAISDSEFKRILDTNRYLKRGGESLQRALTAIKEIKPVLTKEDVASSVLELADYFQYTSIYLQGLVRHLSLIEKDDSIPSGKKLGDIHRAYRQALAIEKHVRKISELFDVSDLEQLNRGVVAKNPFLKNLSWVNAAISSIKDSHKRRIVTPVVNELQETFAEQNKSIEASFNDQINKLKTRTQTPAIAKRIKALEKERDESLLTPENIQRFLTNPDSPFYLAFDSAVSTKSAGVQLIAQYIRGVNNEFQENIKPVARDFQDLMDEVAKEGSGFLGAVIRTKDFFKPYYRETVLFEVVDGKLVKDKKVLSLNTKVKTIELRNRITELKYAIEYGETEEIRNAAEEDLRKFYEEYTERPFTDEYYEIQKGLPEDVKASRNRIFQEMAAIRETFGTGEIDEDTILALKEKEKELYELERIYDEAGELKTGKAYEDALAIQKWKENKRNNSVVSYTLDEDTKLVFDKMLTDQKALLQKGLSSTNPVTRKAAQDNYDRWASVYTRTVFTQEFYDTRQDILDEIAEVLSERGSVQDLYSNLFNLLSGTKDRNGVYNPTEVTESQVKTAKKLEEEIEAIKALLKKDSPLSQDSKEKLSSLIQELQELQTNVNSEYYTSAVKYQLDSIRTQVTTENPDLSSESIEALVNVRYKNSSWYKDNHIAKFRYDADLKSVIEVEEPLFMWRVTRPKDPKYIQSDAPSFMWYKAVVNPAFKNNNYKPGEVTFKDVTGGDYYNSSYDTLTPKKRELLERMKELHYRSQEGLYQKDKLGDLIPGMRKTTGEFLDIVNLKANIIKQFFKNISNFFSGDRDSFSDEEEIYGIAQQTDAFGDPVVRDSRRLFNRYARTLPIEEQSYDIMTAMASYATSSERFKVMRKYQSTILTMEEVLSSVKTDSRAANVVRDLVDRELYGKTLEDNYKIAGTRNLETVTLRRANSIISGVGRLAGFKTLGFNIISIPQNWVSGHIKILSQLGFYQIGYKDLMLAYSDSLGIAKEFYATYNQFGAKSYKVSLVDFFTGTQSVANQASELNNKGIAKYGKVWKTVSTLRDFTEFDVAAVTTYAFLNKYRVPVKGTNRTIPLKDAFELKDGIIQPREDVDIDSNFIQSIRRSVQLANERAQGVYATDAQPTAVKHAWFRAVLFLKKWVIPDLKSTWGSETIHYGAGIKTLGSHRAALRFLRDIIYYDKGAVYNTWKFSSDVEKAGLKQFAISLGAYTMFANLIVQMSLALNCEEDSEADWKDYVCLGLKRTANEVEGVFTLWGLNEMLFTYVAEQANGVSIFEKIGSAALGPFSVWKKFITDDDLYTDEPYYRYRSNSSKVDWDKTHPMLAGRMGLGVLGIEFLGLKGMFVGPKSIEFQNRAFNDYSPKTYTKELKTRYTKEHEGLEVMPTRTQIGQEKKLYKTELKKLMMKSVERNRDVMLLIKKLLLMNLMVI